MPIAMRISRLVMTWRPLLPARARLVPGGQEPAVQAPFSTSRVAGPESLIDLLRVEAPFTANHNQCLTARPRGDHGPPSAWKSGLGLKRSGYSVVESQSRKSSPASPPSRARSELSRADRSIESRVNTCRVHA